MSGVRPFEASAARAFDPRPDTRAVRPGAGVSGTTGTDGARHRLGDGGLGRFRDAATQDHVGGNERPAGVWNDARMTNRGLVMALLPRVSDGRCREAGVRAAS